jgi:hypothetical protein
MSRFLWPALVSLVLVQQADESLDRRRDRLGARVEALRGLAYKTPVPMAEGSRRDGATLALEQARELYGADLESFEAALKALRLLPSAVKLELAIPAAAASSLRAYYGRGRLFVVDPKIADDELVYRLALALSDQHGGGFPAGAGEEPNYDVRMARLAVRHGDADMTKQLYWAGLKVDGARADAAHLSKLTEAAEKWEREASRYASLVLPRLFLRSSDFVWRRGGIFMEAMRQEGGAERLAKVYAKPPASTEQVLHPEKYLKEDPPVQLGLKPLEDLFAARKAALRYRTTLGELGTAIFFESLLETPRPEAPAGWGGDRLMAWTEGARTLVVWATAWDREQDAREFEDAAAAAAFRFNAEDEEARAFVVRRRSSAAFVLNCPDGLKEQVVAALWRGTRTAGSLTEPFGKE